MSNQDLSSVPLDDILRACDNAANPYIWEAANRLRLAESRIERLIQERIDYSNVTTKEGMNSSEWIWRTGKAERELKVAKSRIERLRADMKLVESRYEDFDWNLPDAARLAQTRLFLKESLEKDLASSTKKEDRS